MKYEDLEPKNFGGCNYRSWLAQKYSGMIDCQSPIEALLGGAMETMIFDYQHSLSDRTVYFSVGSQDSFSSYRADLTVNVHSLKTQRKFDTLIVVECDGHAFHEKTKQQAAHDKKRDRWFAAHGYRLLRFTGSEIHKDPFCCAHEIIEVLELCNEAGDFDRLIEVVA